MPETKRVGCRARTPPGNTVTTCPPPCSMCFGIMILVMVCAGGAAGVGEVTLFAPVRERVVTSGTSKMMLEAQMLVMVFSSTLLLAGRATWRPAAVMAARVGLAGAGGGEGRLSTSSVAGCGLTKRNLKIKPRNFKCLSCR